MPRRGVGPSENPAHWIDGSKAPSFEGSEPGVVMTHWGYARVSMLDQERAAQFDALRAAGIDATHIVTDHASEPRPIALASPACWRTSRGGDCLTVWKLGRSVSHLVVVVDDLGRRRDRVPLAHRSTRRHYRDRATPFPRRGGRRGVRARDEPREHQRRAGGHAGALLALWKRGDRVGRLEVGGASDTKCAP